MEPASKTTADNIIAWLRDYAGARINSRLIDERRSIPPQIVLDFGNHGLFGLRAPKHYGGCELSYCDSARVLQQLGGIDLTLATLVSSHALGLYAIQKYGRSALRDQLLAQLASGRELSAFAMTEPQAGSHPLAMKTQARATASGDWILSGEKYLIDSGSWASTIVVFARTAEKSNSSVNLSAFAIRQGTPGLSIGGELLTMGLRGMVQNVLTLRDVRVDADSLLGAAGAGLAISQDALSVGRLNLAAKCVGGMKRCLQLMHRFAGRRSVATGMLFDNPVTQSRTVELACAVSVVESLVAKISQALDKDEPVPVEAFLAAKVAASEFLWKGADTFVQLMGGRGYLDSNPASQILRDARSFSLSEGPTETLLMYLGSLVLNTGSDLGRFLKEQLRAPNIALRLQEISEEIRDRCSKGQLFERLGEPNASYWMSFLAGELGMWAIVAAAAEDNDHNNEFARTWARLKFEERISALKSGHTGEWALSHHAVTKNLIAGYSDSIGDIEQTLSGTIDQPDVLLSKNRPKAGTGSPIDLRKRLRNENESVFHATWPGETLAAISTLAADHAVPNHTILLAGLGALIHRHTAQEQVSVCLTNKPDQEANLLLNFDNRPCLSDLLGQINLPSSSGNNHGAGQNEPCVKLALNGQAARRDIDPAALMVSAANDLQSLKFRYDGQSFGPILAADLSARLQQLLTSWAARPSSSVAELALVATGERELAVVRLNTTDLPYPKDVCVHQLFEEQVERTPERTAVVSDGKALTYSELNSRAEALARQLRALGVKRDVAVGICVDRSLDLPVSLIATWKAGGVYVPLDVTLPPRRLAYMLEETDVQVIIAQPSLARKLPQHRAREIHPDASLNTINNGEQKNAPPTPDSRQCAYILHTSGSTGKPKGVEVCHRAVVNLLLSMRQSPGFSEHDVLVAVTPISFDIAGLELFLPLITGGRVVLADTATTLDGLKLAGLIEKSEATVLQATPATWQILIDSGWQGAPGLKALCGGDVLSRKLADGIRARTASLWNMYGPTETTIWSCVDEVRDDSGPIAIGRPIANTRAYVLDEKLEPVPVGIAGEIFIGGDGVARGYCKQPDLTAERFLSDPFRAGQSMYRTGDLGRFLPDGRIEHLGRIDHQVKIRGFRIELGEIESVLTRHPDIREAAVAPQTYAADDVRLVAYVTVTSSAGTGPEWLSKIQQHVRDHVPGYMVPSPIVVLDQLPLTPHGKVDRRALRMPEPEDNISHGPAAEPPASPVEQKITQIWCNLLRTSTVGRRDDFFALGGHSLLATQIVSRLRVEFGVEIPVALVFEQPTVAGQAEAVTKAMAATPQANNGSSEISFSDSESVTRILADLESLTEEEAQQRLAKEL